MNSTSIIAQENQKETEALISILKALEKKHHVLFSFANHQIDNIKVSPLNNNLSLKEALTFLELETNLEFEQLNSRYITIKKANSIKPEQFYIQKLDEIEIKNYLTSGITKLNDGSLTIKPKNLGILPGLIEPDVLQTIQAIPGVSSIDETVSNINIRGGTHDQNLILWDGVKMYQSGHFFGLISAFNPYITKKINIYRNGSSAKYGDGVSGIIDMQMPNVIDNKFEAGGGINFINTDVYSKIPLSKKTELQLSARRSITDVLETVTFNNYSKRIFQDSDLNQSVNNSNSLSQNESFYFYDFTAKFIYDISKKDKIRFNVFHIYNDLNYDESAIINGNNDSKNSTLSQLNSAVSLSYIKEWSAKLSFDTQFYITHYSLDATNFDIQNNQRLIQENEVYDGTLKLNFDHKTNKQINLNWGYQFSEISVGNLEDVNNPNFRSYIKKVTRSHAVYTESKVVSKKGKRQLIIGGRYNYIPKFNMFFIEPRLSFSQQFLNHFKFEILGEYKSQLTSQIIDLQNDFLGIENRRWVLANNNVNVESINGKNIYPIPITKSKQISAGVFYKKNKLLISAEGYIKQVTGISARSQGFQNQYQFVNSIGEYNIKGIDLLFNKQFNNAISSWISYSYSVNNYLFENLNNNMSFPNNADIRHNVHFSSAYSYKNLKLSLGFNWHTGIPTTEPIETISTDNLTINYKNPNSSNLKDYLRTDFSMTYNFKLSEKTKATFGASIWNLLNRRNIINTYYTLGKDPNGDDSIIKVENESLGITPNVSFRVNF